MSREIVCPVFCPECGEIHGMARRKSDTVTVDKGESDE